MTSGHRLLYPLVFVAGAATMSTEMSASRLLAPFFGASILIWANIIGLILIYLCAGYFIGGRLADRHPAMPYLARLMLIAAAAIAVTPFLTRPLLDRAVSAFADASVGAFLGSFFASMLIFSVPITLLGMASPFAVRLGVTRIEQAGEVAGSGDDFGLVDTADGARRLAVTIARTLRDVYGAPHPAFVTYVARDAEHGAVDLDALGTARPLLRGDGDAAAELAAVDADDEELPLGDRVTAVVAGLLKTTPDALQVDSDGDIGIRSGSAMVFVRVRDNPPLVDVFSPILTEVEPTEQLYVKLSELTNRMPIGRLYCTGVNVAYRKGFEPSPDPTKCTSAAKHS